MIHAASGSTVISNGTTSGNVTGIYFEVTGGLEFYFTNTEIIEKIPEQIIALYLNNTEGNNTGTGVIKSKDTAVF